MVVSTVIRRTLRRYAVISLTSNKDDPRCALNIDTVTTERRAIIKARDFVMAKV